MTLAAFNAGCYQNDWRWLLVANATRRKQYSNSKHDLSTNGQGVFSVHTINDDFGSGVAPYLWTNSCVAWILGPQSVNHVQGYIACLIPFLEGDVQPVYSISKSENIYIFILVQSEYQQFIKVANGVTCKNKDWSSWITCICNCEQHNTCLHTTLSMVYCRLVSPIMIKSELYTSPHDTSHEKGHQWFEYDCSTVYPSLLCLCAWRNQPKSWVWDPKMDANSRYPRVAGWCRHQNP